MPDVDIALALADAMKNDERVNAALIEWLDERYPVEISDGVAVTGLREAIRLVLAEGRRRLDAQDARQERIEALITKLAQRTEASAKEHAERMAAIESSHAVFLEESRAFRESIRRLEAVQAEHSATLAEHSIALAEIREQQAEHSDSLARIDRNVQRMGARISGIRGIGIERRLRRNALAILMKGYGCRRAQVVWSGMDGSRVSDMAIFDAFLVKIESAFQEDRIGIDEYIGLAAADLIAKGELEADGSEMWFVVEASAAIGQDDVDRANERAAAIAKLEGANARGFVYGEYIDRTVADYARAVEVDVVISPQS